MKEKLTLSVDKKVVEKAKEMGINISEITESVLKGFTFEAESIEKTALIEKYKELFKDMVPLLNKLDASTKVGSATAVVKSGGLPEIIGDIYLTPEGTLWVDDIEVEIELDKMHESTLGDLDGPQEILSNFIDSISKATDKQKEKMKELEMARKIIEAISSTVSFRKRARD